MPALKPKIGKDYLAISGLPVRVTGIGDGCLLLQSLASDNCFVEPADYPLAFYDPKKQTSEARPVPYCKRDERSKSPPQQGRDLASVIDPLLLEGGRTMKGLVREVRRRASAVCRGKDVGANIRARLYWLRKRNWQCAKLGPFCRGERHP